MKRIPSTSKEFERWLKEHRAEWPDELQKLGDVAYRVLWRIDNNPPHVIQAMETMAPKTLRSEAEALMAFAEAYGAWKATTHHSK